jgi:hypothetical protein
MGKEWLMIAMLALANEPASKVEAPQASPAIATSTAKPANLPANSSADPNSPASKPSPPSPQPKCDSGPYRSLIGRTISDVLTMRLPPGTRIYRLGDPVTQPIPPGRLNIEINRGTRVGRIYCS